MQDHVTEHFARLALAQSRLDVLEPALSKQQYAFVTVQDFRLHLRLLSILRILRSSADERVDPGTV